MSVLIKQFQSECFVRYSLQWYIIDTSMAIVRHEYLL